MKARVSVDHIPAVYRDACKRVVMDEWSRVRKAVTERMIYAALLALNDIHGFEQTEAERFTAAFAEIIDGHADEAYGGKDSADITRMNEAMRLELESRGIVIKFK
jgi:hypothetical protein